jgi:hypothetical protein
MPVNSKHPSYDRYAPDWKQLKDTYGGERVVKEAAQEYLPPTAGMREDGMEAGAAGAAAYSAYKTRAVFHDFVRQAVEGMVGIMHREPAHIELPAQLESLRDSATPSGDSLQGLLRKINEQQLLLGRVGILGEVPSGVTVDKAVPKILTYTADNIINWDTGLVVLDESGSVRLDNFEWKQETRHLVLMSGTVAQQVVGTELAPKAVYTVAVVKNNGDIAGAEVVQPQIGSNFLEEIPFVFINSADTNPEPDQPPLLGLSNLALAIYRGEADYRQTLFMQGQETLVITNTRESKDGTRRVGAGAVLELPKDSDAKFIGVNSSGLSEQRMALENDKRHASTMSSQLVDTGDSGTSQQSGEALKTRVAAQTANLTQIAQTGAAALQDMLRKLAVWVGANPEEVIVEANTDFASETLVGQELLAFMQAKQMGAPLSIPSIHRLLMKRDLTTLTYEEELAEIEAEAPLVSNTPDSTQP